MLNISWTVTTIPLMIAEAAAYFNMIVIIVKGMRREYSYSKFQLICIIGYTIAILLSSWAEIDMIQEEIFRSSSNSSVASTWMNILFPVTTTTAVTTTTTRTISMLPAILWTIVVSIVTLCGMIVMNIEGRRLAVTRGFQDPKPLSRTVNGWELCTGGGQVYLPTLGTVQRNFPTPYQVSFTNSRGVTLPQEQYQQQQYYQSYYQNSDKFVELPVL